jgi:hypothetical protein|tara:strand:+ start:1454 stop:1630 length:177 start_codon:yes stop_codon:yes gene_type:complete
MATSNGPEQFAIFALARPLGAAGMECRFDDTEKKCRAKQFLNLAGLRVLFVVACLLKG